MGISGEWVVLGLDNGGTSNNATVLDSSGRFLLDRLAETPSSVRGGPEAALPALVKALEDVVAQVGMAWSAVRGVGLDTPGPASADGVFTAMGPPNFSHPQWRGFDIRSALEGRSGAALLGRRHRGHRAGRRRDRGRPRGQGRRWYGRRVRPYPYPHAGAASGGPAAARLQLRIRQRRGEHSLANCHPAEPAAVLADPVSRP